MKLRARAGMELKSVSKPSGTVILVPPSNFTTRFRINYRRPFGRRFVRSFAGGCCTLVLTISNLR